MKTIQVSQMSSPRTGNPVANQFIIRSEGSFINDVGQIKKSHIETFQSYNSIIARKIHKGWQMDIELDEYYHNYSRTTSKYLTQFLNMNTKERTKAIKEKDITLTNLN